MSADLPPCLPERVSGDGNRTRQDVALDGEVLPPGIRVVNVEPEAAQRQDAGRASFKRRLGTAIALGGLALALGSGVATCLYVHRSPTVLALNVPDPTVVALDRLQADMVRLKAGVDTLHPAADLARQDEAIRALKKSVDVLKAEFDGVRSNDAAAMAQLNIKLDKTDHDPAPKLAEIMARIDKLDHDPNPKLAEITARLDRIEKQVSSPTVTGSIATPVRQTPPPVAPQPISTIPAEKALPKPITLDSWVVRDVYDGIALVEGRSGGVREVMPGAFLPGAGEVRSIERRGRAWVVVTSRGIIDNTTW